MSQQTSIAGQPTTLLQSQGDIHESSSSTLASANEDVNDVKSNGVYNLSYNLWFSVCLSVTDHIWKKKVPTCIWKVGNMVTGIQS